MTVLAVGTPADRLNGGQAGAPVTSALAYTIGMTVTGTLNDFAVEGTLAANGRPAPIWQDHLFGSAFATQQILLDRVATTLESAGAFGRRLSDAERRALRRPPTLDAGAFASYLKGRAISDVAETVDQDDRAIAALTDAVTRDPSFALAHAALAQASTLRASHDGQNQSSLSSAKAAADRAVKIDRRCADAYVALAMLDQMDDRSGGRMRTEYCGSGISLAPLNDDVHRQLGQLLLGRDRPAGIAELQFADALRPSHWPNPYQLGRALFIARTLR